MVARLSEDDQRRLAKAADHVGRMRQEADRANQEAKGLERADDATLQATLEDRSNHAFTRLTAMGILSRRKRDRNDGALATLHASLWDDPDEQIARAAIEQSPASDPEVASRLRALLDDPGPSRWSWAATALTRHRDRSIVPRLRDWFERGDGPHRNVAWSCLCFCGLLDRDECLALLREAWEAGGRDDEDRAMIAVGLLQRGDRAGWDFLVDLARRADAYSAVWAAETIGSHDWVLGRELMLHILDHAKTFQVLWGMVERVAGTADLPHCWTADGLAEARAWLESQTRAPATGPPRMTK